MRKFTIEYKGYREVFAESEREARKHAFDCTLSVIESIEVSDVEPSDDVEYCDDCEEPKGECLCTRD
jgi:hypothetical protein